MVVHSEVSIHSTAEVSGHAVIGDETYIWHQAQVLAGARIGRNCIIGKGVFVATGAVIGNSVKVQNYVSIYDGVVIEDGVICGPHCTFTNDKLPRAINPDGSPKTIGDWLISPTLVKHGASIGANATILCGITIGRWAMIGAGSVVCNDIPDYGLAWGNPARLHGFVCSCGSRLRSGWKQGAEGNVALWCSQCHESVEVYKAVWEKIV